MDPRTVAVLVVAPLLGCSGEGDETAPPTGDGTPQVAVAERLCDAPEVAVPDGSCIRPGVPPDGCAEGFVHDGEYGCEPILPAEPCPRGLMAVPGDTECLPVMPCGDGRWGDIPVDATTVYVDAAYTGGGSDGSEAKPFTTIGAAVGAAAPGALIAVAEGAYHEDVVIEGKPVRLWGRCPEKVEVVGSATETAALMITTQASGTEVGGLAIGSPAYCVAVSGSQDVTFERLWVRDCGYHGIAVEDVLGVTSVRVASSLIEQCREAGIYSGGAEIVVESSVARSTLPRLSDQRLGHGLSIQLQCKQGVCLPSRRSSATIRRSLLENNHDGGIYVVGSDAIIESTVVRSTLPQASDQSSGAGIGVLSSCDTQGACNPATRSNAAIRGSLVEQSHEHGIHVAGSDVVIESTVVRATSPNAFDQRFGRGIGVQLPCSAQMLCDTTMRSSATIRSSLIEQNHDAGVIAIGSDALIESTVVRMTMPRSSDQTGGAGIATLPYFDANEVFDPATRPHLTVRGTLVDNSHEYGAVAIGSDALIESTVVRATLPRASSQDTGHGINIQPACRPQHPCDPLGRSTATVRNTLVEDSHEFGLYVLGSDAHIEGAIVRATSPSAASGLLGDGLAAGGYLAPASATLLATRIDDSARAGIASFGASVSLSATQIRCAKLDLNGQDYDGRAYAFDDGGDNACGCPHANRACKAVQETLVPPNPPSYD